MPSSTTSGTEPHFQAMTGVPHAIASIITRPNGSAQSIGNSNAAALPRNAAFSASPISPMYARCHGAAPAARCPCASRRGRPCRPWRRCAAASAAGGDLDGPVGPLLRRDAPEEGEIVAASRGERQQVRGRPCGPARPVHRRHRPALAVGDRHQRHLGERRLERLQVGQVEPAVQRRHRARGEVADQREVQQIDMEMQDVERRARRRTSSSMIRW